MCKVDAICGTGMERKNTSLHPVHFHTSAEKDQKLANSHSLHPSFDLNRSSPIELPHLTSLFTQIITA